MMTADPNEGTRWIDEPLRAAVRELRTALLDKATDRVPAARDAWTEAAQMVLAIMQQHGIEFAEPFDPGPVTPEVVRGLLDEAELSRGPVTPAVRAMVGIFEWLLDQERRANPSGIQLDGFARRAVAIWGGRGSLTTGAIQRASPSVEEVDGGPRPIPPLPASAPTPPAEASS